MTPRASGGFERADDQRQAFWITHCSVLPSLPQPIAPADRVGTSTPARSIDPAPRQVAALAILCNDGGAFEWPHAPLLPFARQTKTA